MEITDPALDWSKTYEDFETADLIELVIAAGGLLESVLLEPEAVDVAMRTLAHAFGQEGNESGASWRDVWEEMKSDFGQFRGSEYYVALNAFAFGGLCPDLDRFKVSATPDIAIGLAEFVREGRTLLERVPKIWAGNLVEIERTVLAAEARLNLDLGQAISIEQLAALGRIGPKSIRNLLTPKNEASPLRGLADGKIAALDAQRWLDSRMDFRQSTWRHDALEVVPIGTIDESSLGSIRFVPVAQDGTCFDEEFCRTKGGYRIGPKGMEETVEDFQEALDKLCRMPTPRWRRPNQRNHWGIVTGVTWKRIEVDLRNGNGDIE